jgi:hypothetical protein
MPVLSAAQKTSIRADKLDNYSDTLDIYSPAAMSGGKGSGQTLRTSSALCRRWPASMHPRVLAKIPDLAGARVDELIFFPDSVTTLVKGGELRSGSQKLKIEGVGTWQTSVAVAASLVQPT